MFFRDQRGATAIEYGLIVALIAIAAIAGMQAFGLGAQGVFTTVGDNVNPALGG